MFPDFLSNFSILLIELLNVKKAKLFINKTNVIFDIFTLSAENILLI